MSTTVNVRVDKSRLPQQLKDNSAATQQQAAQQAVDAAAAEQVRSNNEALRRRQQDATAKFRESRHDPIGRRDGGQVTLPNQLVNGQLTGPVVVEDGAAISVARVGIRRNTSGTKIFVYPWGIEGALGRRLSTNYDNAITEAFGVGVEIDLSIELPKLPPPPIGTIGLGGRYSVPGNVYDVTPYTYTGYRAPTFRILYQGTYYRRISRFCYDNVEDLPYYSTYDSIIEFSLTGNGGVKTACAYYGYRNADQDPNVSVVYKTYQDHYVPSTTFLTRDSEGASKIYEFVLPAGGDSCLVVIVRRATPRLVPLRLYYIFDSVTDISRGRKEQMFFNAEGEQVYFGVTIKGGLVNDHPQAQLDEYALNDVHCVHVTGAIAKKVAASTELVAICDNLIQKLEAEKATGQLQTDFEVVKTTKIRDSGFIDNNSDSREFYREEDKSPITYKAFEASNISRGPYPDASADKQVLAKQLGIGYLETSDHSGKFFTPAIYEWLAGNATLTTRYSEVAPAFYQPGDANNPFVGVYLSVGNGTEDSIEMRATPTQPIDITTAHTALDWVTINTGSRYGDYLVWDWGNPEYCQQRLQALGMNV